MSEKNSILNFLKEHKEELQKKFFIKDIALFGSFARDEASLDSDVDLLVEFSEDIKEIYKTKKRLKEYLRKHLKRDIDLANVKYLKSYAKEEILKEAEYA